MEKLIKIKLGSGMNIPDPSGNAQEAMPGDVVDVPYYFGTSQICQGRAVEHVDSADPAPDNADPAPPIPESPVTGKISNR